MSHPTHEQRTLIEDGLRRRDSFKEIARKVGKSPSTISREVKKHQVCSDKGAIGRLTNRCIHRPDCTKYCVCGDIKCSRLCKNCSKCNQFCSKFEEKNCEKLSDPPFVCNGCREEFHCVLRKQYYIHDQAGKEYRALLSSCRTGATICEDERRWIGEALTAVIDRNQSVHHIMNTRRNEFNVCEKTIYNYINSGILPHPKRHDLPVAPCRKARKKKGVQHKVDTACRKGRTLTDFHTYRDAHPDCATVEMDTVIGRVGGKVLLTMQLLNSGMFLAFLRDRNTAQSVIDVFDRLEVRLGTAIFQKLFPIILTDNGTEFSNPEALEQSCLGNQRRTKIFYCDPYSAWQKGHVENNHLNLRKIFPKGTSFDSLTQEKVNIAVSHINSLIRASMNNVPAITIFEAIYGKTIISKLEVQRIDPDAVCLRPELMQK